MDETDNKDIHKQSKNTSKSCGIMKIMGYRQKVKKEDVREILSDTAKTNLSKR